MYIFIYMYRILYGMHDHTQTLTYNMINIRGLILSPTLVTRVPPFAMLAGTFCLKSCECSRGQ